MSRILIVDDEQSMRQMVAIALRQEGYEVVVAEDGEVASRELQASKVDVVVSDIKMPGFDGIELLRFARENSPGTEVILMTAYTSTESAIEALRLGAYDYISKPFEIDDLKVTVERALERGELRSQNKLLRRQLSDRHKVDELIGRSPGMLRVFDLIQRLADSEITVLITGESGTGKELVAKAIHNEGGRSAEPFIVINCAAMPSQLLESELFGHVRGSFTGADRDKQGLFVAAAGGTLVLDEICELPIEMQPKLLRVLEDHKVRPVGATEEIHIDVRVLAATNRDLQREAAEGRFREDLFYRLNVIQIDLPSLRERSEDILLLAEHFLENIIAAEGESAITGFSNEVKELLLQYPWPGNVRELENAVRRAVTLEGGTTIQPENLPESVRAGGTRAGETLITGLRTGEFDLQGQMLADLDAATAGTGTDPGVIPDEGLDLEEHLAEIRSGYMLKALAEAGGVQKKAAAKLGMSFRSFRYYLDKLGLRDDEAS
ncbi:MAG: sigma-54-dependent Fis family transcriptional regulator [Acidobacteria bacterium]|nr:sigma-54-dependent Fis family transcriptional regulator [Acidobacteriota bacterium]